MLYIAFLFFCLQPWNLFQQCDGHGYLADPPARSSAWLFDRDFAACCQYYNHMQMFCGGANYQWVVNRGKCSICGEAYNAKPQLFGLGDAMYLGKIVRTYAQGSVISVTVVLTANHRGAFEFRVCSVDDNPKEDATQQCLDLHLLSIVHGSRQYKVEATLTTVHVNVTLPENFTCKHCVFQWKYITGNSWGVTNGKSCVGCGSKNEEFYGCSDIAIRNDLQPIVDPIVTTTNASKSVRKCFLAITFSRSFDLTALMTRYCDRICSTNCASDSVNSTSIVDNNCRKSCDKLCVCQ